MPRRSFLTMLQVAIFILVSFALVLVGPTIATRLADTMRIWDSRLRVDVEDSAMARASCSRSLGIASIYYFAPDVQQEWVWLAPGAFFANIALGLRVTRLG